MPGIRTPPAEAAEPTTLLQSFFNVRRKEIAPVVVAAFFFFCVMTALMVLRPARDALGIERGIESVRWLFFGTALATLAVNPVFGWLVARLRRMQFISTTYAAFGCSLLVFWALLVFAPKSVGAASGQVFYVWFSVFNLFATMVVWALLTDRFSLDQSKRFFALVAVGGTLGAVFGPWLSLQLAEIWGTATLLLVATAFLALGVLSAWALVRHQPDLAPIGAVSADEHVGRADDTARIGGSAWAGLRAAISSPYLLGISAYVVTLAIMTTFIYFTRLQMVAAVGEGLDERTALLASIDLWTQVAVLVLQVVLAGHVIRRLGVSLALALLPLTMALGFLGLAIHGSFLLLVLLEAASRAVQRGVMRPARETLYTVLGREDKYKAKAFIDTFMYRAGDVVGAQAEGLLGRMGMGLVAMTSIVVPLAFAWGVLGIWLGRAQAKRAHPSTAATAPSPSQDHVPPGIPFHERLTGTSYPT